MATFVDPEPAEGRSPKHRRLIIIAAALSPVLFTACFLGFGAWVVSNMFTRPPGSVEHTPLMPDARNVTMASTSKPEGKVITYQTATAPADVYKFYEDVLVKDGWGGQGYFPKPQLTTDGIIFDWYQSGPNGCEELGYTLHLVAAQEDATTTLVQLELARINPC